MFDLWAKIKAMAKKKTEEEVDPKAVVETAEILDKVVADSNDKEAKIKKPKLVPTQVFEPMIGGFKTVWVEE